MGGFMNSKYSTWPILGLTVFALLITAPVPSFAQGLEEIVVTARKREESLQDVPISVQAFSGDELERQRIFDIGSLAPYTPNFQYAQAPGASDLLIMRGLGTYGSGVHFEPSVGQVFNGYFSTRSRLSRTALIDVAQVEVLRGPQGAIIGKNTSLGAINITTNKPTEEFEAKVSGGVSFESSEGYEAQGIISGPLSDNLRGRAVLDYRDIDGWIDNRFNGDSFQEREDLTVRLMLEADMGENVLGEFLYQYNDLDRNGKPREVSGCLDPAAAAAQGFDCELNASNQSGNIRQGVDIGEPFTTEAHVFGATFTWDLGNVSLASLSNFTTYEITDNWAGDLLSTERASIDNFEEFDQFYQEFRLTSTGANDVDYTAGLVYFTAEMDFVQDFQWVIPFNFNRHEVGGSETDSVAAFGQIDWSLNEQWTLTLGGRFTDEERSGFKSQTTRELYTGVERLDWCNNQGSTGGGGPPVGPRTCTLGNDGMTVGGPITGDINDSGFSYNASLQWSVSDNSMLYGLVATGFKSGGFDLRGAGNPDRFIFPEEESTNFELGGKHTLQDGAMRFNWTLFQTEVEDLQVSTNDPVLIQQVVGQADVTNSGLEVDFAWAATDEFNVTLAAAFLDSEFDSFISNCYAGQTDVQGCMAGLFDQTGMDMPFAPEFQAVAGGDYTWTVGNNMELNLGAKWIHIGDMHTMLDRDPRSFQDATNRFDATLGLSGNTSSGNPWNLALVGKNLSDEKVFMWCNSSGLSGTLVVSCALEELRYVALRGTFGFQ